MSWQPKTGDIHEWGDLPRQGEIGQMNFELFDWNDVINNFQQSIDYRCSKEWIEPLKERSRISTSPRSIRMIGLENINYVDNPDGTAVSQNVLPSFVTHNAELIPSVAYVRNLISNKHNLKKSTHRINSHLFMSFIASSEAFGMHCDSEDTYIWQVIGTTPWRLKMGTSPDAEIEEFVLEPNDMIFIPKHWDHSPLVDGPRCSVSFSIEEYLWNSVEERLDI